MMLLTEYKLQQEYTQFGTNVSPKTRHILQQGALAEELFRHDVLSNIEYETQIIFLSLLFSTFLINRDVSFARKNRGKLLSAIQTDKRLEDIRQLVREEGTLLDTLIKELEKKARILGAICQP